MTDLIPLHDHAALQSARFIRLLESIDYPYEISPEDVHAVLSSQYQGSAQHHAAEGLDTTISSAAPASAFLDWLVENVSAETNWPGYKHTRQQLNILQDPVDEGDNDDDDEEENASLQHLDQQQWQLQNTFASLENELSDLKALETLSLDFDRTLDLEIHDTSVKLDATASKLAETANSVFSEYLVPSQSTGQGNDHDQDRDRDRDRDMDVDMDREKPTRSKETGRLLYQCQEELLQIQQLDKTFVENMELLFRQVQDTIQRPTSATLGSSGSTSSSSTRSSYKPTPTMATMAGRGTGTGTGTISSHLQCLLACNPLHDQELVRLCSTYRATKMSHIRAVAQLKSLEQELEYMKDLDAAHNSTSNQNGDDDYDVAMRDQDTTGDHRMYSLASSRNQILQKTRQQEIELISVQRETARLIQEMDQLLSDPTPRPPSLAVTKLGAGSGLGGRNSLPTAMSVGAEDDSGASGGVLFEICERIARNDIELRFLTAAHRDFLKVQGQALQDLDTAVQHLLDYYCLGLTLEQTLNIERQTLQQQRDLLDAAVQEAHALQSQSKHLQQVAESHSRIQRRQSALGTTKRERDPNELLESVKQSLNLRELVRQETQAMQDSILQMTNVKDMLDTQLLQRYSSTKEIHFVPKTLHALKEDLVKRSRQLQHDYTVLDDQVQQHLIHSKSKTATSSLTASTRYNLN
ncbi:hypothetical protein BC939DRAFT_500226 [Gamsiella multidivaricata]|uniref:uncharacterized protein n=1 Tax=Gamsiella multidivaricata TaxID=101098 RepID=UPI002220F5FB|nr:uncharacterized protein BC939DRAFT_500226 [Gamsiella multidivaricata]KAG0366118.1 hypothetical protein BGZ54_005796 [Gamsiella multidivaricata]KAI7829377.1 hypothetical protein BC939DRAFT_500226 [Gamsiella multidivaricata]